MKLYKLTEQNYTTYNGSMKWGEGITNNVKPCKKPSMCSSDVIHAYTDLNLALLLNPIHADIKNPRIFEASGKIVISDWDKCGVFKLTTKKEIDAPEWYKSDKKNDVIIMFAILCAESVLYLFEEKFPDDKRPHEAIKAAKEYLKNKNNAAARAADAAANAAAYAATLATYAAARAADAAANAAANAAAYAAAYAAARGINFAELAKQAIKITMEDK